MYVFAVLCGCAFGYASSRIQAVVAPGGAVPSPFVKEESNASHGTVIRESEYASVSEVPRADDSGPASLADLDNSLHAGGGAAAGDCEPGEHFEAVCRKSGAADDEVHMCGGKTAYATCACDPCQAMAQASPLDAVLWECARCCCRGEVQPAVEHVDLVEGETLVMHVDAAGELASVSIVKKGTSTRHLEGRFSPKIGGMKDRSWAGVANKRDTVDGPGAVLLQRVSADTKGAKLGHYAAAQQQKEQGLADAAGPAALLLALAA